MPNPHPTALMITGTVVEDVDGTHYRKTLDSGRDPFPWTTEDGCTFGDERIANLIADGAQVISGGQP